MNKKSEKIGLTEKDIKPEFRGLSTLEIIEKVINESATHPVKLTGKKN